MLVFGPYRAMPTDEQFVVFNLSSPVQAIPRLPGLLINPPQPITGVDDGLMERDFDIWYYEYVLNDPTACSSLMAILTALYDGQNVYVCIADYSDSFINVLNESLMKLIQVRYDIKYSIVNSQEDFLYIPRDGCDFMSVQGIQTFDADRRRFLQLSEEQRLICGGRIDAESD